MTEFEDDVIGFVFPTYGGTVPKYMKKFLSAITVRADYVFAIATYGMGKGLVTDHARNIAKESGYRVDYANAVLMLDNCQPQFDIAKQKEKLPAKKQFAAEQEKKANDLNLITEMIDWIYERDTQDVNGQIRLSMFTLTKMFQEKAVESHAENYRSRLKVNYQVSIGEYSTFANFKREDEGQQK